MPVMNTETRAYLKDAITKALHGETDFPGLDDVAKRPQEWTQLEKCAWLQLHNWSADKALLTQYPGHAQFARSRLSKLLVSLES